MCSNGVFNVRKIKYCSSIQSRSSIWGKHKKKRFMKKKRTWGSAVPSPLENPTSLPRLPSYTFSLSSVCVYFVDLLLLRPACMCVSVCVCVMQLCVCALQYTWEPKVQISFVKHGRTNTQLQSHARATAACSAVGGDVWTSCQHIYILVLRKLCTRQ